MWYLLHGRLLVGVLCVRMVIALVCGRAVKAERCTGAHGDDDDGGDVKVLVLAGVVVVLETEMWR